MDALRYVICSALPSSQPSCSWAHPYCSLTLHVSKHGVDLVFCFCFLCSIFDFALVRPLFVCHICVKTFFSDDVHLNSSVIAASLRRNSAMCALSLSNISVCAHCFCVLSSLPFTQTKHGLHPKLQAPSGFARLSRRMFCAWSVLSRVLQVFHSSSLLSFFFC